MKLITPEWLYGRIKTDSFSAIQSDNGASLCVEPVISFESESLWMVLAGLPSSSTMYFVFGVCDNFWLLLCDVLKMFRLLSSSSSRRMIFLFSSFCGCCCCCCDCIFSSFVVSDNCVAWMWWSMSCDCEVGVSFMNGLKRFWPLPGVYGVVVNWEFCFGGDEPVRSNSVENWGWNWENSDLNYIKASASNITWSFVDAHRTQRHCIIVREIAIAESLKWSKHTGWQSTQSIRMRLYMHPIFKSVPAIRNRWRMWTMSCWVCIDWFVYFAHLLRLFARFLTSIVWWPDCWSHSPYRTSTDSCCRCRAASPSFSTWESAISAVVSERRYHHIDLIRNHCNSLQRLR